MAICPLAILKGIVKSFVVHFTVEPTEVGDKGNSVSANLGDNTTNASSEETVPSEGRSPMGCVSETHDSSNMAEKKVASELPQDVPGTEGSVSMPL